MARVFDRSRELREGWPMRPGGECCRPQAAETPCQRWLACDEKLNELTLLWSHAEQAVLARNKAPKRDSKRILSRLDRQIRSLYREQTRAMKELVRTPARDAADAVEKLRVLRCRLDGEGREELALVTDALRALDLEARGPGASPSARLQL